MSTNSDQCPSNGTVLTVPKPSDIVGEQSLANINPDEKPIFRNLPEMPEEPEEDLEVVSEEDLQELSSKTISPIVSVDLTSKGTQIFSHISKVSPKD
jgi:hypothetical protein